MSRRRGTIIIVVMLILAALAGMVLVVGRSARVEAMTSANHVADAKAAAVERAAEEYVVALVAQQRETAMTLDENQFTAVRVGDAGMFWIVRPDYGDSTMPIFGLVDEASKINLNLGRQSILNMLLLFPSVPEELANSIPDWRDGDSEIEDEGAEDPYYLALPNPYRCKNGSFETVEELLLVRGADRTVLFGDPMRTTIAGVRTGSSSIGGMSDEDLRSRGLFNYITVYSREPAGATANDPARTGRINLNTAPREVLRCIPGLTDSDAAALIDKRGNTGFGSTDLTWANQVLGTRANQLRNLITGQSYQFSADIVAASKDGRAFRHVRIVVDASDATNRPKVVYRSNSTSRGWPMEPGILASLRAGSGQI